MRLAAALIFNRLSSRVANVSRAVVTVLGIEAPGRELLGEAVGIGDWTAVIRGAGTGCAEVDAVRDD